MRMAWGVGWEGRGGGLEERRGESVFVAWGGWGGREERKAGAVLLLLPPPPCPAPFCWVRSLAERTDAPGRECVRMRSV